MNGLKNALNIVDDCGGIGELHPFTLIEYASYDYVFASLNITTSLYLQMIDTDNDDLRSEIESNVKNFDVLCTNKEFIDLLITLLSISFKQSRVIYCPQLMRILINGKIINRDNFDFIRDEIIKINDITLPRQAKTKELQKHFDRAYQAKNNKAKNAGDMEDIVFSIMAFTGYTPNELKEMTLYQVNKLIARLNKISEYEANIKFICAGSEKINLEHWSSKIISNRDDIVSDYNSFTSKFNQTLSK